jgi:hypothetical protein
MPKANLERARPETVLVELPICDVPAASWPLHLDVKLTPVQSQALRRITQGLDVQRATLTNGRRVVNATDALRFLLEQVASPSGTNP